MIAGLAAAIVAAVALYLTDAPLMMGAHPQWAAKVISIGAPIGIFGFLALIKVNKTALLAVSAAGLIVAYAITITGRSRFGASYGDDVFAGQMWYFGWIAICAAVPLCAAAIIQWAISRRA